MAGIFYNSFTITISGKHFNQAVRHGALRGTFSSDLYFD